MEPKKEIIMDGGNPDLLVMNPRVANDLRALLDNSNFVRVSQDENKLGLGAIERVITQYSALELVMDRWCPVGTAYILESGKVGFYTLRGFEVKETGALRRQSEGRSGGRGFATLSQRQSSRENYWNYNLVAAGGKIRWKANPRRGDLGFAAFTFP